MSVSFPGALANYRMLSEGELSEMRLLGVIGEDGESLPAEEPTAARTLRVPRTAIESHDVLNEAYQYDHVTSAAFTRGLRIPLGSVTLLLISGTASVDENGRTIHPGDFRAQCWRTYRNLSQLLKASGATWHDVVRCSCYLRDIERDYDDFNKIRNQFFSWLALDPLPASTGIQARLCREDLLIEIESMVIIPSNRPQPA